jgi:hypothetical protein
MRDLIPGLIVLAIGLFTGTSTLQGHFTVLSVLFDAFALFFIGRGLLGMYRARSKQGRS